MRKRAHEPHPEESAALQSPAADPALSNRGVARSVTAPAAPAGRGLRPDNALIARLATPRRAIARAATKIETYGTFSIDNYDPVDSDRRGARAAARRDR
jgi:hypothetical protein